VALEPGTLARAGKADRQDHGALRLLGGRGRLSYRFGGCGWRLRLAGFAGWTARPGQGWRLRRSRWTIAPSATSTAAVAAAPERLLRAIAGADFRRRLGFLKLGLVGLRFELRLLALRRFRSGRFGKLRLQRRGTVLSRFFCLRLAPPAAVAAPSAHVALVTRLPSREQSGLSPFCASMSLMFYRSSIASPQSEC
jgi:hypothetical protein